MVERPWRQPQRQRWGVARVWISCLVGGEGTCGGDFGGRRKTPVPGNVRLGNASGGPCAGSGTRRPGARIRYGTFGEVVPRRRAAGRLFQGVAGAHWSSTMTGPPCASCATRSTKNDSTEAPSQEHTDRRDHVERGESVSGQVVRVAQRVPELAVSLQVQQRCGQHGECQVHQDAGEPLGLRETACPRRAGQVSTEVAA